MTTQTSTTIQSTMQAIVLTQAGGVENLHYQEVATPSISADEVLVKVKAISLNPADVKPKYSQKMLDMMYANTDPIILGWDIAGVVVQIGDNVSDFAIGDKVFGMVNFPGVGNAYAQYVASPANHLTKMPENTDFIDASGATLAGLTALQLLQNSVQQGDKVLIHGGSGGVGHYAIQIAKRLGAYVYTTSSAKNHEFVLSLGADEHIDYATQGFETQLANLDVVLDVFGGEVMEKSLNVLKQGGTLLSTVLPGAVEVKGGDKPIQPPLPEHIVAKIAEKKITANPFLVVSNGDDMATLANMFADGTLKTNIHQTFPFTQMREAQTCVENGGLVGKVVVTL